MDWKSILEKKKGGGKSEGGNVGPGTCPTRSINRGRDQEQGWTSAQRLIGETKGLTSKKSKVENHQVREKSKDKRACKTKSFRLDGAGVIEEGRAPYDCLT